MTTNTNSINFDLVQYMYWLGIDPTICKIVADMPQIKREIMYELRHNMQNISTKKLIIRVLNKTIPYKIKLLQKKI